MDLNLDGHLGPQQSSLYLRRGYDLAVLGLPQIIEEVQENIPQNIPGPADLPTDHVNVEYRALQAGVQDEAQWPRPGFEDLRKPVDNYMQEQDSDDEGEEFLQQDILEIVEGEVQDLEDAHVIAETTVEGVQNAMALIVQRAVEVVKHMPPMIVQAGEVHEYIGEMRVIAQAEVGGLYFAEPETAESSAEFQIMLKQMNPAAGIASPAMQTDRMATVTALDPLPLITSSQKVSSSSVNTL